MATLPDGEGVRAGVAPDALSADKEGGIKPQTDAQDKAMRIAYAYSKDRQSAAELVQTMIDGAVQDRSAEILEALEAAYQSMLASYNFASYVGRTTLLCGANGRTFYENCKLAEAAIRKARGTE